MESYRTAGAAASAEAKGRFSSVSPTSSASPPLAPAPVVLSPCAACKILRRRCVDKCVLAPYFPPTEPLKFIIAHRVFGASNIIKSLQELPAAQRQDAVDSMVYEATARLRDPIYGCAGAICHLMNQISELQAELAKAQAEILNMQCLNANLFDQISKQMAASQDMEQHLPREPSGLQYHENSTLSYNMDEGNLGVSWETLWT